MILVAYLDHKKFFLGGIGWCSIIGDFYGILYGFLYMIFRLGFFLENVELWQRGVPVFWMLDDFVICMFV